MEVGVEVEGVILKLASCSGVDLELEGVDDPSRGEALLKETLQAVLLHCFVEMGSLPGSVGEDTPPVDTDTLIPVAVLDSSD